MGMLKNKKGFNYFTCFCDVTEIALKSAECLTQSLKTYDIQNVPTYLEQIQRYENEADDKKHELCTKLTHEFMPPIAREDILLLADELDDITDSIEDIMQKIYMFNITDINEEIIEAAELLLSACTITCKLLSEFSNFKKSKRINEYIIEINTMEHTMSAMHIKYIRILFSKNLSASNHIAYTKLFDSIKNSMKTCESAANTVGSIVINNT